MSSNSRANHYDVGTDGTKGTTPDDDDTKMVSLNHSTALANKRFHEKVDFYLHRPVVEYIVIFLIITDAILVTASLLIEIKIIEKSAKSSAHESDTTTSQSSKGSTGHSNLEKAGKALHYSSLAILTLFFIEIFLKLYGQREKFFKRKIQVVDSFIVAISLALDIAVLVIHDIDSSIINGLGLIIILRLWRLARIVNGAVVATTEKLTEHIHEAKRATHEAKERIVELEMLLEDRDSEIEFLKGRLCKYEPIDMIPTGSTRLPAYLPETKEFPKQVLGDVTDDEDYRLQGFPDIHRIGGPRSKPRPTLNTGGTGGTAFQAYQPGVAYQPTSQYPAEEIRSRAMNAVANGGYLGVSGFGELPDEVVDTADESDVVSIKPSKSRSGNTFTVSKGGVPMTSM